MTFAHRVLSFNKQLALSAKLPPGIEVMNPFADNEAFDVCRKFYEKYYNDESKRYIILGINPGRRGGGLTGIPFTDPVKLQTICGIENKLDKKAELSADFIYYMISAYGGPKTFYKKFYFNSVCPLGFTANGKNLNYYDSKELQLLVTDFILKTLQQQIDMGIHTQKAFCMGEGQNFKFLSKLNERHKYFKEIVPLAHPRFIMQYKRKSVDSYVTTYLRALEDHDSQGTA